MKAERDVPSSPPSTLDPPPSSAPSLSALPTAVEQARQVLDRTYQAREQSLPRCRTVVRHSANAIRSVHRGDVAAARQLLDGCRGMLDEVEDLLREHPDVYYAGFVHDAQKEFVEGEAFLALVGGDGLPGPQALGVHIPAYLNGLGECVGELRRYVLDLLRRGQHEPCEGLLLAMDEIYAALVTLDYPEAITGGLRRTADSVRGILERTRGDLTLAVRQQALADRLDRLRLP
ncbi:MAG: haloacid dehalogenase [Chloroflexi bacterium]|nr:haloacid dehalogenase [Chloroflexota bacterium]